MIHELYVPKKTGSYADALEAMGLADLVKNLQGVEVQRRVTIKDAGGEFVLSIQPALDDDEIESWIVGPGYPYIKFKSDDPYAPIISTIDYEGEREKEQLLKKTQEKGIKGRKGRQAQGLAAEEVKLPEPIPELPVLKAFNSMRMGSDTYNALHRTLRERGDLVSIVRSRLQEYVFPPRSSSADRSSEKEIAKITSNLQLFNPVSGKGIHRPKPDGTGLEGLPDTLVDWFSEWMKFRALLQGMSPYQVGDDYKILVICPGDLEIGTLSRIQKDLLGQRLWGSVRLEIEAVITLAETLIERSEFRAAGQLSFCLSGRSPKDLIVGFFEAHFKSLGTARALTNVSFIGLPGWFPVQTKEDAEDWLDILHEHRACIRCLREDRSDDIPLLETYRDFISSGRLRDSLNFFATYGAQVMIKREQDIPVRQFTTKNLGRLFMSYDKEKPGISKIIGDPGFKAVATAVRKATVNAQYRKAQGKPVFEVHYGLAQDWKRKAKFPKQFTAALCDFIQQYNAENARHAELDKERRDAVTTEELGRVLSFVEDDSELVCMLLLGMGYAREERGPAEVEG